MAGIAQIVVASLIANSLTRLLVAKFKDQDNACQYQRDRIGNDDWHRIEIKTVCQPQRYPDDEYNEHAGRDIVRVFGAPDAYDLWYEGNRGQCACSEA